MLDDVSTFRLSHVRRNEKLKKFASCRALTVHHRAMTTNHQQAAVEP